jgi:Reverse transcriptase (RNA-dependent DNA polymerase)
LIKVLDHKWIIWIQNILACSKIYINFNDDLEAYFHYKRGARQGDPPSPFLFDFVADVLNTLLKNARTQDYIKDVGQITDFSSLVNLHFAHDTLLFLEAKHIYIEALKRILVAFEDLSGSKIN